MYNNYKDKKKRKKYLEKYQQEYWIKNKEKLKKQKTKYYYSPSGIWSILRMDRAGRKISKEDFVEWYNSQSRKCIYCNIEEEKIIGTIFKKRKVSRLQIDRKNPNKPYQKGNLALACPQCNWMKGSHLNFEEMKLVGQVLEQIRIKRLDTSR